MKDTEIERKINVDTVRLRISYHIIHRAYTIFRFCYEQRRVLKMKDDGSISTNCRLLAFGLAWNLFGILFEIWKMFEIFRFNLFEICGANSRKSSSMVLTDWLHLIQFLICCAISLSLPENCTCIFPCAGVIAETAVSASKRGFCTPFNCVFHPPEDNSFNCGLSFVLKLKQ